MELDDHETLKLVQDRMVAKLYSHNNWEDFITWGTGMSQAKFKTLILQCLDGVVADGDVKKADLLEKRAQIEG